MEKTSRMTVEEERRQGFEARRKEEALRRLEQLTKAFELNGEILNQLKEGAISYCFPVSVDGMELVGMIGVKCFDQKWREEIEKFEREYDTFVYIALANKTPCGEMLSMLYVSSHEETWEWERPTADYATAYVYNFDMKDGEFGDIFLTSNNGALIRKA